MKKPHERANRLSMRRLMAAYTNASPLAHSLRSHTASRSLCSSSCSGRSKRSSVPLPTDEVAPGSPWEATVPANPPSRLLWPTLSPNSSAPLLGHAFVGAPRDPRSTLGSSRPSPCPLLGSPRQPIGEKGGRIADPLAAVAS